MQEFVIEYPKEWLPDYPPAEGRNGYYHQHGLVVECRKSFLPSQEKVASVFLRGMTSRKDLARGRLWLPLPCLTELIRKLQSLLRYCEEEHIGEPSAT